MKPDVPSEVNQRRALSLCLFGESRRLMRLKGCGPGSRAHNVSRCELLDYAAITFLRTESKLLLTAESDAAVAAM